MKISNYKKEKEKCKKNIEIDLIYFIIFNYNNSI